MLLNRRRFERFALPPMYTGVTVRPSNSRRGLDGHVYDLSEAGLRFELDRALPPGTMVELKISMPARDKEPTTIDAHASVVWVDEDEDEPGPARMAAAFVGLAEAERRRLIEALGSGRWARAA